MRPIGLLTEFQQFPRQVHRPGKKCKPFGPDAAVPQPPRLNKAHGGINGYRQRQCPEVGVGDLDGGVHHGMPNIPVKIDMQMEKQVLRIHFDALAQKQQGDSQHENHDALQGFEGSDSA